VVLIAVMMTMAILNQWKRAHQPVVEINSQIATRVAGKGTA
jgi:hypothetical protein